MSNNGSIDDENLMEAYLAWKYGKRYGVSIRKIAKKLGKSKSEVQRKFKEIERREMPLTDTMERASQLTHNSGKQSEVIENDPELQHLDSDVQECRKRVETKKRMLSLMKEKKELEREQIELDAQLDTSGFIKHFHYFIDESLCSRFFRVCTNEISFEEALSDAFDDFVEWVDLNWRGMKFRDYVNHCIEKWITSKEMELVDEV